MDPQRCAQVAVRCCRRMIEVPSEPLMCCDNCHIHPPSPTDKPLIGVPKIITNINTKFRISNILGNVSCLSDEEIWMSGQGNILRLYNLKGKMLKEIKTRSRHTPNDIAVSKDGYLVYVDYNDCTVNKVYTDHFFKSNAKIKEVVRLHGSRPYNVCSTSSGDLLVVMISDNRQTKVVLYSGSGFETKKIIQFDDKGQSLYSSAFYSKSISENMNKDICVADSYANAVVVVNEVGKLRYNYTGLPSTPKGSFVPIGITTDSQSRILTSDNNNFCIHIIDQDGQFLRYIDNCNLDRPYGLCVDTSDNLFVVEYTGDVKKIKYCR